VKSIACKFDLLIIQILDNLLGNWQATDTLRSMHADMEAEDVELMTAWLRRHHTITLKPFLKVKQLRVADDNIASMACTHLLASLAQNLLSLSTSADGALALLIVNSK
jgi:hypothetical protein